MLQADQRRGRTGRTCDGQIYRLVTRSFFGQLDDHEGPTIMRLSLRMQVLNICCADSKAINDPKGMLFRHLIHPFFWVLMSISIIGVILHSSEKIHFSHAYRGILSSRFLAG